MDFQLQCNLLALHSSQARDLAGLDFLHHLRHATPVEAFELLSHGGADRLEHRSGDADGRAGRIADEVGNEGHEHRGGQASGGPPQPQPQLLDVVAE